MVDSEYVVLGTITMQWLLGGTMVGVPQDLSHDLWGWPRRFHETCHVTCGCGLGGPMRPHTTRWCKKKVLLIQCYVMHVTPLMTK